MASQHKNVFVALAAAQGEMGPLVKGATNPHFKSRYATLDDVVNAVRPPLNANGLCFHFETRDGEMVAVLTHGESETSIKCGIPLLVSKNDIQAFKSATTYAKRMGLESITGIAPADDDDGTAAAKAPPPKSHASTEALRDAWRDSVMDGLPDDATPRMKAQAFALAICMDFAVKTVPTLEGRWNRHKAIIDSLGEKYPDLHEQVVDAFEMKKNEITDAATQGMAAQ